MKIFLIILILGGILFVAGMASTFFYIGNLSDKFPEMSTLMSEVYIEPGQSFSNSVKLVQGEKTFLTIMVEPSTNVIYFSLERPDNTIATEFGFSEVLSLPIIANSSGDYTITLGNMGNNIANINGVTTSKPIIDDADLMLSMGINFLIASLIIVLGILLLIIGVIILIISKKRIKKTFKEKTK